MSHVMMSDKDSVLRSHSQMVYSHQRPFRRDTFPIMPHNGTQLHNISRNCHSQQKMTFDGASVSNKGRQAIWMFSQTHDQRVEDASGQSPALLRSPPLLIFSSAMIWFSCRRLLGKEKSGCLPSLPLLLQLR